MNIGDTNGTFSGTNESNPQSVSQAVTNGTEDSTGDSLRYRLPGDRTETQSSDGDVTQIQRDLRTGSPGTVVLDDFQPGAPKANTIEEIHPLLQEVEAAIAEADSVIDETDASIVGDIATDIIDAESIIQEAGIAVTGEPELEVGNAETLVGKAKAKILTDIEDDLREAYSYMSAIGIPIPTDDEVSYAEASQDYASILTSGGSALPTADQSYDTTQSQTPGASKVGETQNAPQGQPQPKIEPNTQFFPTYTVGQTFPPNCTDQIGGAAQGADEFGAPIPCNNTNRCAVEVQQPFGPPTLQAIDQIVLASGGAVAGDMLPLEFTADLLNQLEAGTYQTCYVCTWSHNTAGFSNLLGGPIGSFNGPCYLLVIPIGYHVEMDPTTGVLWAVKYHRPGYCGVPQLLGYPPANVTTDQKPPDDGTGDSCPPKFKPCKENPDDGWKGLPGASRDDKVCEWIDQGVQQLETETLDFAKFITMNSGAVNSSTTMDAIINALTGGHEPVIGQLLNRFAKWAQQTVKQSAEDTGCTGPAMVNSAIRLAVLKFVDQWTSIIPHQLKRAELQKSNTVCQSEIPTGSEVDGAYLADTMTKEEWECYHKALGNFLDPAVKVLDAKRTRITAQQADLLYRRKKIDNEEKNRRMREAGVLRDEDRFAIRDLNEHWPPQSEIIRLMNRDVFNKEVAEKSKLFEGFEDNYNGKAEDYGDALGIPKELMKLYYGAHWQLPSYTMAKEFYYRFGHGDVPENLRFTESDFRQLLKQDDWAPGHIDRMIAASLHPIAKRDAIQAYMIHVSSDEEFIDQLMKVGYARDNAEFTQRYYKKRREITDRKTAGYPTFRSMVNSYARCEVAEDEFTDFVADIAIDQDQIDNAIKAAKVSRKVWQRKQAIRTIKKPFMLGITDVAETSQELAREDVDPACVDELIKQWQRERQRADKHFTASQLCEYRERGILSAEQQLVALVRINWTPEDAAVIVTDCGMRISEKQAERARREAERAARQLKQLQKEQEKAARLAECGPPPCPANRQRSNRPVAAGQ